MLPQWQTEPQTPSSSADIPPSLHTTYWGYLSQAHTHHQEYIPNYGEPYRHGETISTAFVESTINQVVSRRFAKLQQMHWTLRGAHLLLQTRTKVLNNELEGVFRRWYPLFRPQAEAA
jgi:hypothetical protein